MKNEKRKTKNEKRKTKNEKRKTKNEKRKTKNEKRRINGKWFEGTLFMSTIWPINSPSNLIVVDGIWSVYINADFDTMQTLSDIVWVDEDILISMSFLKPHLQHCVSINELQNFLGHWEKNE